MEPAQNDGVREYRKTDEVPRRAVEIKVPDKSISSTKFGNCPISELFIGQRISQSHKTNIIAY